MYVAQFRKSVSHGIVDGAQADVAAFNMNNGNAQGQGNRRRSQHFVTVCDQEKQVGAEPGKIIGKAKSRTANSFSHTNIAIGTQQTFNVFGIETISADITQSI